MKYKEFFDKIHKDVIFELERIKESEASKTRYGISGKSIYADHDYVLKLAIEDQKELRKIFNTQK